MGKVRISLLLVLAVLCALGLTSCSSSHTVSITLSPSSPPALTQGETLAITATVANDTNNEGVTWSITGVGSLSNSTTTSVTYVAPAALSANSSATITATSIASTTITATVSISVNAVLTIITTSLQAGTLDTPYTTYVNAQGATGPFTWALSAGNLPIGLTLGSSTGNSVVISGTPTVLGTSSFTIEVTDPAGTSVSQALSITINKPPPLSIATTFLPDGSVGAPYGQTLQASSGSKPYSWSLTAGSLPAGLSLSAQGVISGTPEVTGTSSFSVQVLDSSTPQQKATAALSITIEPSSANNSKLVGNYAFLVSGFDPNGHFVAAGSFVADGAGDIGSGIMDTNDPATLLTQQGFSGTYLIGSNDLGTMTLNTSTGARSFALALSADGSAASIIEFDDFTGAGTRDSGVLVRQDVTAFTRSAIINNYAFGLLGTDAQQNRFGMAGELQADGAGNFSNGLLDSDDAGTVASSVAFTGTYSVAPSGRGTATITIPGQGTTNYSFYVVSPSQLLVMEIDYISGQSSRIVSGSMLSQGSPLNNGSLNSVAVFDTTAYSGSTAQTQVGLFQGNGSGGLSLTSDLNTGGTLTSPAGSGTYSVTNGRATLSNSGFQNSDPVLYLVAPNEAFIVGTDASVTFGFMQAQTGTPFLNASLAGTYAGGSIAPVASSISNEASIAVADGVGNFTFTTDASSTSGLLENQVSAATYSVASNGRVVVTENASQVAILYLISPTQYALLTTVPSDPDVRVDLFQQ